MTATPRASMTVSQVLWMASTIPHPTRWWLGLLQTARSRHSYAGAWCPTPAGGLLGSPHDRRTHPGDAVGALVVGDFAIDTGMLTKRRILGGWQ